MNRVNRVRASLRKDAWIVSMAVALLISQLAIGCDDSAKSESNRMQSDQMENSTAERPPIVVKLGEPIPAIPEGVAVNRRSYGAGHIIVLRGAARITVISYEGRSFTFANAAELVKITLSKRGSVRTVSVWALPRPMPWKEALPWFKDWLKTNKIKPNENLQKKLEIWSNNDFPGNELPRHEPRQDVAGTDLTPTSALGIRWKPHPERDWVLVLGVGLTAEEMGELRKKEAANEGQVDENEGEDRTEDALDKFQRWHETHGEIDIEKLLNDEDYGPFE